MKLSRIDIISILIIVAIFIIAFNIYPSMPDRMPTHWNAEGEIDGYGNRFLGVFLFPIILLAIYLLFFFIPKISVYKKNLDSFMKYFEGMKLAMILFLSAMYVVTLLPNFGVNFNMSYFIIPAISALFYYIGYILQFSKQNYFFGIRTPWTMADDEVWDKTHKLGSITFRVNAFVILFALISSILFFWVFVVCILINVVILFAYSKFIWTTQ
jgi:uncharacterized membrane protein